MRVLFGEKCCLSAEKIHFWSNVANKIDHDERKSPSKVITDPIRQTLAQWPSKMSRTRDPPSPPPSLLLPSPFPSSSPLSSWTPKTLQFPGKNAKIVMFMTIFYATRGSYSLGRVLLRRNTLYGCYCSTTRMWRTSSWCSICLCSQIAPNS